MICEFSYQKQTQSWCYVSHYVWATEKNFHLRLSKKSLKQHYFTFSSYWKTSDLDLTLEDFCKKRLSWKNFEKKIIWKYSYFNYVEFCILAEKDQFCFYKNSVNQFFTFIRSNVVCFNKHLTSTAPLGNKVSTAIKCYV